ncbi:DNA double-strand break repair nuclease NurA [Deinococcus pimensis]|uniref:DNA double-strand break repair nuclease NurA n=1 Tax=Deinococcus pimensis TaxID=309888 RepID=UPI00048242E9|nr:DNA double-strand break repair nuclease NurA [Deinococcus pimensis]
MRIRLDPWPIDTLDAQLSMQAFRGDVIDIETPRWAALPAGPVPAHLQTVYVVDGKPRMEARLLIDGDGGEPVFGGYGAYVVGAVDLCPHGSREAVLRDVQARRVLALCGDVGGAEATRLLPRNPHSGELLYSVETAEGNDPTAPQRKLQSLMLAAEQRLSHGFSSQVPYDEDDDVETLAVLTLQDGPLRRGYRSGAVVGCVKTMQTMYVSADRAYLLSELRPGERSPILHFRYEGGSEARFTWYVRLCEAEFYQHPYAGVMRLEMHAPYESDFLPDMVRQVADLSGTLLCRLGSKGHKDPRAPQNLIPTRALEQAMGRAMGDTSIVMRRIRAHLQEALEVVA